VEGIWPIFFLAVVLKIPVFFGIWLVWWASKSYDEFAEDEQPGTQDHGFRRWRRSPKPKGPRRGPHGGMAAPAPDCPPGGRRRTPAIKPRVTPGVAAQDRR
jgi:hypothetical protein